ncbi:MAG: choice-of-anchor D domain-containing protein [Chthoniobacterales bacterium]
MRADINLPTAPPPQPLAQTVQVAVGGTVDIPLRGVSRSGQQLSFLIRTRPQLGTVSGVTVLDKHSGVLRYRHDVNLGAGVDRFRYAVQVPGSGVSTPAEVIIRVVDKPSRFEAPASQEFQPIAVGKTRTKVLTLRNDGGGVIAGQMELPEPWIFTDGDGSYRLAEGEFAEIAVTFAPQSVGRFSGEARFSHTGARRLSLSGEAFFPVEAPEGTLEFQTGADGLQREATLRLKNRTNEPRLVDINAPPELGGPREVKIDALAEIDVPLRTNPDFLAPLEGTIGVVNEGVEFFVPIRVFAAPAKLVSVEPAASVDFGSVLQGRSVRKTVSIKNVGGADAQLRGAVPTGVSTTPVIGGEALVPGGERSFELVFVGEEPGEFEESLEINDSGGSAVTWTLRAIVEPDPRFASGQSARPTPIPGEGSPKNQGQPKTIEPDVAFAAVEEIRLLSRSKNQIQIEWDNPSDQITRYEMIERQFKFRGNGDTKVVWEPIKNTTLTIGEKKTTLTISKLRPGQRITLALIGFDEAGRQSKPSMPFIFDSEHSKPIHVPWMLIGIVIVIFCIYLIRRERLRQKQELDHEFEKINRWR